MASSVEFKLSRKDLQSLETPSSALITDVKALSSYNWIEAPVATPTIAVPGIPALWSFPGSSKRLKKDSGFAYIAQNAARHPESPLEPLFRALYITRPSFDICSIDVVTDRNNIRKLLSFVDPSSARNGLEAFTINIEMRKNTAIFCREEAKTIEYIGPNEFKGYGREFEKAFTINQVNGSTGHHRIISYRFGDLSFIIRHETDGYDESGTETSSRTKNKTQKDLSSMLGALSLSPVTSTPGINPVGSNLILKEEGYEVPLESTLEIKTRVLHKRIEIEEVAAQLWVSQTPKLVRAYHEKGTFQRPVVEDVSAAIKSWEERKQNDLRKLAALIQKIIILVKECGGKGVLKYNVAGDTLVVCKAEAKEMLPKDLYLKWDAETSTQKCGVHEVEIAQTQGEHESTVILTGDDQRATIRIGDKDYSVSMSKFPYLATFVRRQKTTHSDVTEFSHEPIKLFDVALKGVESGYRHCFRSLPIDLSQYRALFKTYKFLEVDILNGMSNDHVIANLKVGRSDYDPEERRHIDGNKSLARDTAFQLLYLILHADFGDQTKDGMKLYNAVMFVVSHPRTFKYSTKRVIRLAYDERFVPTMKQRLRLDQWKEGEAASGTGEETTEEEPDYFFDSDSDYSF